MQLEDNFFHNLPSSVRKATDFVIDRVSSNVIKNIRSKIMPELRESAIEQVIWFSICFYPKNVYNDIIRMQKL